MLYLLNGITETIQVIVWRVVRGQHVGQPCLNNAMFKADKEEEKIYTL
jgi:hypothetical protein